MPTEEKFIALVFTDVVNSTELTLKHGRVYLEAQQKYRRIVRETLTEWHGTEIKTLGDGFFLTFAQAIEAAHWAKDTQIRLSQQNWESGPVVQVRIGLHLGSPLRIVHPDGREDYDGDSVNFAARIMDVAHGGQIFASHTFQQQVSPTIAHPFEFRDGGRRDLKGLGETRIWQLHHPDLPALSAPEEKRSGEIPPSNLPFPPHAHFCGREEALLELRNCLHSSSFPVVALVGMGGLGKTQMAVEYGHAYLMNYPGGVYWLDARNNERLLEDYAILGLRFFGLNRSQGREQIAEQVRDGLMHLKKPALVIYDNVTEMTDMELLPPSGRLHLLLTTQRQILPANVLIIEPPRLSDENALQLLQVFRHVVTEKEKAAALGIARTVGNLPLALALASHHIRALGCSFSEYLRRLNEAPYTTLQKGRDHFKTATRHEGSIYDTIDLSVRGENLSNPKGQCLDENALKTLTSAACFAPNSIPTHLLFKITGIRDYDDFEGALLKLWERSLLLPECDERTETRQSVHELIRIYARTNLLPSRRRTLLPRAVRVLTDHLRAANRTLEWESLHNDLDHCDAVAATARGKIPTVGLEELLLEIGIYQADHRNCAVALGYYAEGLALARQRQGEDNLLTAKFLRLMGESQEQEGQRKEALRSVRKARRIARKVLAKDALEMADYCNSLGFVLKMQGQLGRALPFYHHALALHQAQPEGKQSEVAVLLNNLGTLLEDRNELESALDHFQRGLDYEQRANKETVYIAVLLNNTGRVLSKMDRCQEAISLHERARGISEEMHGARHPNTAACFFYLAEAQHGLGQYEAARDNYHRARKIYEHTFGISHLTSKRVRERLTSLEANLHQN